MNTDVLVVGGAMAGIRTAEGLRRMKFAGRVVVLEAGTDLLYDRPALSKQILTDGAEAAAVMLRTADELAAANVELVRGHRAVSADVDARTVTLDDGTTWSYRDLVVATGSTPRRLPGAEDRPGVHYLRTLDDALALRSAVRAAQRVVVVGAGFIGSEVAAAAAAAATSVTVVEPFAQPLGRVLGDVVGERLARLHRSRGVDLRLGRTVTRVQPDLTVLLDDGSELQADVVVVGIGATPNTEWLDGSGLDVRDGVVCDEFCRASAEHVYAVGDVARWPNSLFDESMRIEHWTNAVEQAGVLAWNLTHPLAPRAYAPVPYVWSDQYGSRLQIVGRPRVDDEVRIVTDDSETGSLVALYVRDGRLSGAFGLDAPQAVMAMRRALAARTPLEDLLELQK
ncbi:NAD(P)/FAD-dependent oxidoreductase [Cryptosporangium sp. NPDC048952]|uniref:NAD(P)/FAD-dependent oxidoreductase n=1 Tax=Cryptosporangium sp. NPDC048952 TaxID=3363961 RepID=UPI00371ED1B1